MDYHLKPISRKCAATGTEFEPGNLCHSTLIERDGKLIRLDFSQEGWTGPPEGAIGHWKCIVPEPAATKSRPLDADALMRYFEQLSEGPNIAQEKFRYVLALLLLQKRRLKIEGSRQDGEIQYLQLSGSRGEGQFDVRDHQLSEDEILNLQNDLNTHLATEWT